MAATLTREAKTGFFEKVQQLVDAWNRHNFHKVGQFYSNAIVSRRLDKTFEGKEAIRQDRERLLWAFPDLTMKYTHQFSVGTHGVLEWTLSGTHQGVFETSDGDIQPTGKRAVWSGVTIWEFDEAGQIIRERVYSDSAELVRQLR